MKRTKRKRVCLLTGASGTFGRAFIQRCAADFDIAAVHYRHDIDHPSQTQHYIDPLDPRRAFPENSIPVFTVRADLADPAASSDIAHAVLKQFGRVDILINAAADLRLSHLLADAALTDGAALFAVNVFAPLQLTINLARRFWEKRATENIKRNRNVVNISSTSGLYVFPDSGQALYSASKAALNFATYHLASEFWDIGIRVNGLAPTTFPGRIPTEQVVSAVLALDQSTDTGRLVILDVE